MLSPTPFLLKRATSAIGAAVNEPRAIVPRPAIVSSRFGRILAALFKSVKEGGPGRSRARIENERSVVDYGYEG